MISVLSENRIKNSEKHLSLALSTGNDSRKGVVAH